MSYKENHKLVEMRVEVERDITPGLQAVDSAIAFVRARGTVTSSELHAVMDLPADDLPSEHLVDALEDGRLVKQGKFWTLGAAAMASVSLMDVVEVEAA